MPANLHSHVVVVMIQCLLLHSLCCGGCDDSMFAIALVLRDWVGGMVLVLL